MDRDIISFEEFFAGRIKEKGLSLKRLSEITGISSNHLENMIHGNFESMPSAPYFHGYLARLGKVLDFESEEWWEILKQEGMVTNSGELDTLPRNRFVKKSPPKLIWVGLIGLLVLIFLVFQIPRIFGKPSLIVTFPAQNPYTTSLNPFMITGMVKNADSLYLNLTSGNASSGEEIVIAPDGSWQMPVRLQNGPNPFEITAKKFLGGETNVLEKIIYEPPEALPAGSSTAPGKSFPVTHTTPNVPATGTFFD